MHIEKRKDKGKIKYYLAHSFREGSKVHKLRKYLGRNLSQETLNERKQIAEKLILEEMHKHNIIFISNANEYTRKLRNSRGNSVRSYGMQQHSVDRQRRFRSIKEPLHIELSKEELESIKKLESEIPLKIEHLSELDWKVFSEIFTYNTNAIEGSRLNIHEVKDLLEKDKWPDKSKEDIAEAYGVDEAISFIRTTKEHISIELIKKIHKIVFKNSKPFAGKLRKKGEDIVVIDGRGNVVHEGAPQQRISYLLRKLIEWYDKNKTKYPALVLGAVVHNQFENIHPFRDGNGRVGRILLNNILIKHGLPPINIDIKNRAEYYASLRAYEINKDLRPTINLYMKEYKDLKRKLYTKNS